MRNFAMGLMVALFTLSAWADPTVIIVGGGAAGLESAELLKEAGIPFVLLESESKGGGRLFSRPIGDGLVIDEYATLINSNDDVTLERLKQFDIPILRRFPEGGDGMNFLIKGKIYTQAQANKLLFETNGRVLWRIAFDRSTRRDEYFTETSIEKYLKEVDADSMLTQLMESFFWSEYGHRLHQLNVHVLHDYFAVDLDKKSFQFIPNYDEAFSVPGGAGQLTSRLEESNRDSILYNHKVTKIVRAPNTKMQVTVQTPEGEKTIEGSYVIYAAPIRILGETEVNIPGITPEMVEEAGKVGYARGVKLHLKFRKPFRTIYKFGGILTTDTGDQIWTSSQGQPGDYGLLTVLTGPQPLDLVHAHIDHILTQIDIMYPGIRKLYMGFERSEAPFSYSGAMKPGEAKSLKINELKDFFQFITVGEASSEGFQGYLEGAFSSARIKTQQLVNRLKGSSALCELHAI